MVGLLGGGRPRARRSREFAADRRGAEICGLWIARSLRRMTTRPQQLNLVAEDIPALAPAHLINPLSNGSVARMFATHPSVEERIKRRADGTQERKPCDMETLGLAAYLTLICWCAWLVS
jgi:hypothetical protein